MAKSPVKSPKKSPAKKAVKKAPKKEKGEKKPRAPSAYNLFMKSELAKVKAKNPSLSHKEAFTVAASSWAKQKK